MKKLIYILLASILFAGCDKLPDDSTLDGMWQLMNIHTTSTDTNVKDQQLYWSFRLSLIQFTNATLTPEERKEFFAHSLRQGDDLLIYDLCNPSENATTADNNEWLQANDHDLAKLARWGIYPQPDTNHKGQLKAIFRITKATSSTLILTSDSTTLTFRKF